MEAGAAMGKLLTVAGMLLCLGVSTFTFAQTSNATLGGTVSDATGALIPGVSVTATNTATGIITMVISNESGAYQFASLQTGTYKVTAELAGFQTAAYDNVTLGISQQVRLNFALQVGSVAQAVEVTVAADTLLATSSSSVGSVLSENKIRQLPLGGRSVMDLLVTTAGAGPTDGGTTGEDGYFAGGRLSAVNTTRDGFVVSDGRYNHGAFSVVYTGPDLVEEVRVITAPVDAEAGRGSGQVQMVTRSGTNQFRGSLFWANRNSALDASNWFNNFNGVKKDYENRNSFGGRIGGPIIKNKTFFFVLVDEQRDVFRQTFVGSVLTPLARQGIYRFFPGVDNQNATQNNPTVDRNGNPVRPANATGDLQQFSVFRNSDGTPRDPNRPGYDPSGFIQNTLLSAMPMPNDYTVGDGLNTAGIRFTRHISGLDFPDGQGYDTNRDQINWRLDHNFSAKHKLSVNYTWERGKNNTVQSGIMNWPGGYNGSNQKWPMLYNGALVSTLSQSIVNELRIGFKRGKQSSWAPWYVGRPVLGEGEPVEPGLTAYKLLPKYNGIPLQVITSLFPDNIVNWTAGDGNTRNSLSPQYSYADTLSWTKGQHAYKAGFELRFGESNAGNDSNFTPQATLGPGGVAVVGIDNVAVPGLTGPNQTVARNLLTDLSGSINRIAEAFDLRNPNDLVFRGYNEGIKLKIRDWKTTEYSWFFKDSWKARKDLTLNLGIHYEWFGVPYEGHGIAGAPVGGAAGLCGISCGSLTTVELVGKNSPNPNKQLWGDDNNNFAPSVGFSWSLPWFGKDKTVIRGGYGWSYVGSALIGVNGNLNNIGGSIPGTMEGSTNTGIFFNPTNYLNLVNVTLPIQHQFPPLKPAPLNGQRSDVMQAAVANRVSPYIQNFNFEIQREIFSNFTLDVAYVGTKGTHLWGAIPLNNDEIFKNGLLDAFNTTRTGGNAKLFDDMLRGLNLGSGVINGTTVTGSAALRANTNTRTFIANGSVGQLADFLNRSTSITGFGGGFVRNSGLFPENFFVLNPQFNLVNEHSNPGSSTYHSLQLQATKRLSQGFTNSFTYTFSRAIGENDGDAAIDYRDPNNRSTTKALLGFDRTHAFTTNGTYELPFGPNKSFLANAPQFVQRIVEGWQLGGLFSWISGAPLNIVAPVATINQTVSVATPNIVGDFPKSTGKVTKTSTGVTYFAGLQQVTDPSIANVTSLNALSGQFTNKAITDAQGRLLLVNPQPGQIGSLGLKWVKGPPITGLNMNLLKRVRITETKEFELRVDAVNVLNHPVFGNPNLNINSTGTGTTTGTAGTNAAFGRILTATGNRRFTIGARLNF
jgi:hypothetical protein